MNERKWNAEDIVGIFEGEKNFLSNKW